MVYGIDRFAKAFEAFADELYRFSEPADGYPVQIELLARHSDLLGEPSGFHIEPIPTDEEPMTFELFNKEHERCMNFLKDAVDKSSANNRIIVTHHLPSFQLSSPDFKGSRVNGAFVADEDDFIEECSAEYWIYGHSHRNIDKRIGNTQFISNQLGYVFSGEHLSFKQAAYFEI